MCKKIFEKSTSMLMTRSSVGSKESSEAEVHYYNDLLLECQL